MIKHLHKFIITDKSKDDASLQHIELFNTIVEGRCEY